MKMTLSLEGLTGGAQPQGAAPFVDPALAQLFAALLSGSNTPVMPDGKAIDADTDGDDGEDNPTDMYPIAGVTGNFLPHVGNPVPTEGVKAVASAPTTASFKLAVASADTAEVQPARPGVSPTAGDRMVKPDTMPLTANGIEWTKLAASQVDSQPQPNGLQSTKPSAPTRRSENAATSEIAIGDASRLAQLRSDTQPKPVQTPLVQTHIAQQAAGDAPARIASANPELVDTHKAETRSTVRTEQISVPESGTRPVMQPIAVPIEHGARPVSDGAAPTHVRFELTKQIDRAVAALDAAPSDTVERAAKLTIPHDRLGTMALHLSRDDDGGIGLRADTMPQDIRLHIAEGAAQAERRVATAPQPTHQGSLSGGSLGENTQGRGSNGEPRSSLDERSGSQRDNTSARRDGQAEAQQRGRRQAPRDGGIFA